MAFNDELLKPALGRVIRVDGSIDGFSTTTYRWGDSAGLLDGTNMYQARVMSVGAVRRGLGQQRIAAAGTCELVLSNADGALDGLAGRANIDTQAQLRLRIYVCVFTPGSASSFTSKLLGEFSLAEWVRQDNNTLILSLADDVLGAVSQQASLPTMADWHAVGTSATNPLYDGYALPDFVAEYTPIQLAFGEDWVLALPHVLPFGTVDAAYQGKVIVPICATSSTAAVTATEISELRVLWYNPNSGTTTLVTVPQTVLAADGTSLTVWRVERSPTITKNGKSWKVIYLVVRADLGAMTITNNPYTGWSEATNNTSNALSDTSYDGVRNAGEWSGNYAPAAILAQRAWAGGVTVGQYANDPLAPQYASFGANVVGWFVKGYPLSARTQTSSPIQHPVDVLTDLVTYYSDAAITVNSTEAARAKKATAQAACAGVVQSWQNGPKRGDPTFIAPPSLRQVISAICQSADIDVFIDWSGQFSFATDFWDFRIATSGSASWSPNAATQTSGNGTTTQYLPTVIPETWLSSIQRWVPSDGERWAAYNRLWFNGAKLSPADGIEMLPYQGPFDFDASQPGAIALTSRIVEGTLEQGWRPIRQQARAPWFWRALNVVARDMVRFRTHIGALQLELGQYFALTWTRGSTLGGPYSGAIFQCESITYAPDDDSVEVTAIWRDDVQSEQQYILDNETLLVRTKNAGNSPLYMEDSSTQMGFLSGSDNFITMGVEVGDIVVMRDTSEAADSFKRNRCVRIASVDDGTTIQITDPDLDFGLPTTGFIGNPDDWYIVRGATTYPTAVSDPTNYPLGGDMYGKATDINGEYSDASEGNRLISG